MAKNIAHKKGDFLGDGNQDEAYDPKYTFLLKIIVQTAIKGITKILLEFGAMPQQATINIASIKTLEQI